MARQITPPSQRVVTQYHDGTTLILETEYSEQIIIAPDDSVTHLRSADNIALTSGEMFHPGMASGQNPVLVPGLCAVCRRGHKPALTNAKHLRLCARCGSPTCPAHRKWAEASKKWYCRRCYRRVWLGSLLRGMLCERIEE